MMRPDNDGDWFPVMAMAATGLGHAITNTYLIPAGLHTAVLLTPLQAGQVRPENSNSREVFHLDCQPWTSPGNLAGGLVFAGLLFWSAFRSVAEK
jgi:formate/nitrite transporter FocA (FNT family)